MHSKAGKDVRRQLCVCGASPPHTHTIVVSHPFRLWDGSDEEVNDETRSDRKTLMRMESSHEVVLCLKGA